jgi:hypothetical protein
MKRIVKPNGFSKIPKEASDVHGITTDYTMNYGMDLCVPLRLSRTMLPCVI